MCDHCKTYKPMLNGANPTSIYGQEKPRLIDVAPRPEPTNPNPNNSCCSWRKTCCDGVCCNRAESCCSSDPAGQARPAEKPAPFSGYGYSQPTMPSYSYGTTAGMTMPDRVPCSRQENKLPMCFGGDCGLPSGSTSTTESSNSGTTGTGSTSKYKL